MHLRITLPPVERSPTHAKRGGNVCIGHLLLDQHRHGHQGLITGATLWTRSRSTFFLLSLGTGPANRPYRRQAKGAIEVKPPHIDELPLPADELEALSTQMFEQARNLSQLEAHTLDALSHIWITQATHPEARAVVDIDELLALRGLKPKKSGSGRRGGYMPEQRREMLQALSRIRNLWLRIDELATYEDNGSKTKKGRRETRRSVAGPAFVITGVGGQPRIDGGLDVDRVSFTPGEVLSLSPGAGEHARSLFVVALESPGDEGYL